MTQSISEPYTIPQHITAASACLRLAQPYFYAIEFTPDSPANFARDLAIWRTLRTCARALLERGALELSLSEACALRETLRRCPPGRDVDFLRSLEFTERG
jgi:tRNA U34 5-methylaminomethyl-2-thiouridine-forming methyltransferase MnmC